MNMCLIFVFGVEDDMTKMRKWIEKNMLLTEILLLLLPFVITLLTKFVVKLQCINAQWIKNLSILITKEFTAELINVIDVFSIVFGIIIFFLDEWIKEDTENVVYLLIITIALAITHIFKLFEFHYLAFFLCISIGILVMIPFWFMIEDNLRDSMRRIEKRNTSKKE